MNERDEFLYREPAVALGWFLIVSLAITLKEYYCRLLMENGVYPKCLFIV